eukprot:m.109939 g.109939  ORF g.109939 m.109939 type:complete len:54 (+) comp14323_c0_seq3:1441-1602(+)
MRGFVQSFEDSSAQAALDATRSDWQLLEVQMEEMKRKLTSETEALMATAEEQR